MAVEEDPLAEGEMTMVIVGEEVEEVVTEEEEEDQEEDLDADGEIKTWLNDNHYLLFSNFIK